MQSAAQGSDQVILVGQERPGIAANNLKSATTYTVKS